MQTVINSVSYDLLSSTVEALFLVIYKYNSFNLYKNPARWVVLLSSFSCEDIEALRFKKLVPNLSDLNGGARIDLNSGSLAPKETGPALDLQSSLWDSLWTLPRRRGHSL